LSGDADESGKLVLGQVPFGSGDFETIGQSGGNHTLKVPLNKTISGFAQELG